MFTCAQVCNTLGQCHCDVGFSPPDCSQPGSGGSNHSNAPPLGPPAGTPSGMRFTHIQFTFLYVFNVYEVFFESFPSIILKNYPLPLTFPPVTYVLNVRRNVRLRQVTMT